MFSLLSIYQNHINKFFNDFDSIKDVSGRVVLPKQSHRQSKICIPNWFKYIYIYPKSHYLIGLLVILYIVIDMLLIIYQAGIFQDRNYGKIQYLPNFFSHRLFPKMFWRQADFTVVVCLFLAISLLISFLRGKPMNTNCCMFLNAQEDEDKKTGRKLIDSKGKCNV